MASGDDFDAELDEVLRRIDSDLRLPEEEDTSAGAAVDAAATAAAVQRDLDEACVAIEHAQRRLARVVGARPFGRELRLTPLQQRLLAALRSEPPVDAARAADGIDRDDGQPAWGGGGDL
eukprot:4851591-Prymnesium_polylepis.1